MKKRRRVLILLYTLAAILVYGSLVLRRTVGQPWASAAALLGVGLMLLSTLVAKLRTDKEESEEYEQEEKAEAARRADPRSAAEEEQAPDFLLLFHNPTSRIYQVFRAERAYLFHQVGGELRGIKEEWLLDHCPTDEEFAALPGKNFRVELNSVGQAVLRLGRSALTNLDNCGAVSLYSPKKSNYILLGELTEKELRGFFRDLGPRLRADEKKQNRRREDLAFGRERKARQDPAIYRRLYLASIVLLALGALSSVCFLLLGRPYALWAVLCLVCWAAAVTLGLVFPDYFSLMRNSKESIRDTGARSIGLIGPIMASAFGLLMRSLLDFNFIPFWSVYLAGGILSLLLLALFVWRMRELRGRVVAILASWFLLFAFSIGVPAQLNALLDFREPEIASATVVDKHISSGSRGPDIYVLKVELRDGTTQELHVSRTLYEETRIGEQGSVAVFQGALFMPYAEYVPGQSWSADSHAEAGTL